MGYFLNLNSTFLVLCAGGNEPKDHSGRQGSMESMNSGDSDITALLPGSSSNGSICADNSLREENYAGGSGNMDES